MGEYELDHHDYLDEEINHEKNDELTDLGLHLIDIIGTVDTIKAVAILGQVWSEEQGVFGYEVGRHETIYYKTWYISHDIGDQFRFENMALGNDDDVHYDELIDGLKRLGI